MYKNITNCILGIKQQVIYIKLYNLIFKKVVKIVCLKVILILYLYLSDGLRVQNLILGENKMVKSKKASKSTLIIIVLAMLLVASMILGITGAWFTKSDTKVASSLTGSVRFGNIATATITLTPSGGSYAIDANHVIPGDTIAGTQVSVALKHDIGVYATLKHEYTSGQSTVTEYYKMANGEITKVDAGLTTDTLSQFLIAKPATDPTEATSYTMSVAAVPIPRDTESETPIGGYTITMGNTIQITSGQGTYYLYVIQKDNITAAQAVAYLTTGSHLSAAAIS